MHAFEPKTRSQSAFAKRDPRKDSRSRASEPGVRPYELDSQRKVPELDPQFLNRLVPLRGIFGECAVDDIYKRQRNL